MHEEGKPTITAWRRLYGLDIETECAVTSCLGFGGSEKCDHALDHNRGKITKIAVTDGLFDEHVFDSRLGFLEWDAVNPDVQYTAQSGKFDFRFINSRVVTDKWVTDSNLLAFTWTNKIPDSWLIAYEEKRKEQNALRSGMKHRPAKHHSLKTLAPYFLGVEPFWEPEAGHNDREYVLKDARYCLQLTQYLFEQMPEASLKFCQDKMMPWAKQLMQMELTGITLDIEETKKEWSAAAERILVLEDEINAQWSEHFAAWKAYSKGQIIKKRLDGVFREGKRLGNYNATTQKYISQIAPLNLDSPVQLKWLLEERLGLDAVNFAGEESTDKETLNRLSHEDPEIEKLLEYRGTKKLISAFFPEYLAQAYNGTMHCTFNISRARTGRLSCNNPNLQQTPKKLRRLFVARPGHKLITRDLSAIEPTILAYYSEDPVLCELIQTGGDFHGATAVAAFDLECLNTDVKRLFPWLRDVAKTIGLAVLYGAGANQVLMVLLKNNITGASASMAKRIVTRIREKYKGVWSFKEKLDQELEAGAIIHNLLGRPFSIPQAHDVYMKGLNTLIQGSASDHVLDCLPELSTYAAPLVAVHDEVVVEAPTIRAEFADRELNKLLTSRVLMTQYGVIPIRTEGKISGRWEK